MNGPPPPAAHAPDPAPAGAPTPKLTEDARHRLVAATLGAHGQERLVVRAADLRALIARTDDVEAALEALGENEVLRQRLARAQAQAAAVPIYMARIAALEGQLDEVRERAALAARILSGKPA